MTDPAKPTLDQGELKPGLTAQTPADQVTYGWWTPPNGISHSTGCPPHIVGSWRSGIPEAATALTPATVGPGLARPTVTVEDLLRANGMEVVPAAELVALRADREMLDKLDRLKIGCFCAEISGQYRFGARQAGRFNVVLWRDSVREAIAKVYIPEEDAQK